MAAPVSLGMSDDGPVIREGAQLFKHVHWRVQTKAFGVLAQIQNAGQRWPDPAM